MVSVWVRELGVLLCGIAAAAIFYIDAFTAVQRFVVAVPVLLGIVFLVVRWARSGERLAYRRFMVGAGALQLAVFEACALNLLNEGIWDHRVRDAPLTLSGWLTVAGITGFGFVISGVLAHRASSLDLKPKPLGFRFGVKSVLLLVLFSAVMLTFLKEVDWLVESRVEAWLSVPNFAGSKTPARECASLILLSAEWHPISGWQKDSHVELRFYWHECDPTLLAGPPSTQTIEHEGNPGWDRFLEEDVCNTARVAYTKWNLTWGDPFTAIEAFVSDDSVAAWTEDEFLKWISAREARGK